MTMSKTKIEELYRLAIYNAYKGKCFYTDEPIAYQDFEVDHIIPESMASEIEDINKRLHLGDDFHINSIDNLVPCRPGVNIRKNNKMFSDNTLLLYFEKTKAMKQTVVELHDKYKEKRQQDKGYKAIDLILSSSPNRLDELNDYIHKKVVEQWKEKKITLNHPINFEEGELCEVTINGEYRDYLTKALELFGDGSGVKLINENDESVEIHSLTEWKEYTDKGYYPLSNADIKMSGFFEFLDGLISALEIAQMPKLSFFKGQRMKDLVRYFSTSVLIDCEKELPDTTIGELVSQGKAEIEESGFHSVCIKCVGFLNTFSEQFRADLTNDGIENIFCYVWRNADGGSVGWGETVILGCHKNNGIVEIEQ